MRRRVAVCVAVAVVSGAFAADRVGHDSAALGQGPGPVAEVSGTLVELAPRDLVHADYASDDATAPDHQGIIGPTCMLVRNAGFVVQVHIEPATIGVDPSAARFDDANFESVGAWSGSLVTDGVTVTGSLSNRELHRCPTRPTVIGDVVGSLTDGSSYSVEVVAR